MQVINVIRFKAGSLDEVKSFIFKISDTNEKDTAVLKSEKYFIDSIKNCVGYDEEDINNYLDDGYFIDTTNQLEFFLNWST